MWVSVCSSASWGWWPAFGGIEGQAVPGRVPGNGLAGRPGFGELLPGRPPERCAPGSPFPLGGHVAAESAVQEGSLAPLPVAWSLLGRAPLPGLGQHPWAGKYLFGFLLTALSLLGPWFVAQGLAVRGAPGPLWEGLPGLIWAVPCPLGGIAGFGGGWAGVGAGGLCRAPGAGRFTVLRAERQAALRLRCLPRMDVLTPPCELTSDPG